MAYKANKFKVGQTVRVVGDGLASKGWVGTISFVRMANRSWPYTVAFKGREMGEYAENEIELA